MLYLFLVFEFLLSNYGQNYKNTSVYYDSLYKQSLLFIEKDELRESITLLKEIIEKDKSYTNEDNKLIMNAHYDLGQIYLSRSLDYETAAFHFDYIFNNIRFIPKDKFLGLKMKSLLELKTKSLFMLGYVYHNHIGNLSKAQKYYNNFLDKYPNNDLSASVEYELTLINEGIFKFKQNRKD